MSVKKQSAEDTAFVKELRDEFLESARVDLDDWESDLLDFESGDDAKMKDLLRHIHSMKGSSQAIGLVELGEVMHELENWLAGIGSKSPRSTIVSTGLGFVDQLRAYCVLMTKDQSCESQIKAMRGLLE